MTAKAATAQWYKPFLIVTNIVYVFLLLGRRNKNDGSFFLSIWDILGMLCSVGLQIYSYFGILDQAANANSSKKNSKELTGGQHLDWMALSITVQFLSMLHSTKWYWLLFLFPIVGGYSLYSSVFGGAGKKNNGASASMPDTSQQSSNLSRREKRAEKRRTKNS